MHVSDLWQSSQILAEQLRHTLFATTIMPNITNRAAFRDSVAGICTSRTPSQCEIPGDPCHCTASLIRTSDIRSYTQYTHLLQWTPDNTPAHDSSEIADSGLHNQGPEQRQPALHIAAFHKQPYPDYLPARRYMAMQGVQKLTYVRIIWRPDHGCRPRRCETQLLGDGVRLHH